LNYNSGTI